MLIYLFIILPDRRKVENYDPLAYFHNVATIYSLTYSPAML